MKKTICSVAIFAIALLGGCCGGCDKPATADWQPLFGENLAQADYNPEIWSISPDGVISAEKDDIIFSKRDWQNFELELEFKIFEGSNSGIVVYCSDAKKWIPNSLEIQIADNRKFWQPRCSCGSVYGLVPAEWDTTLPLDQWQKMRVVCSGKNIDVWLNDRHCASMDMSKWTNIKINPDGSPIPQWIAKYKKCDVPTIGKVGLQGKHGKAGINFRNVNIRELAK